MPTYQNSSFILTITYSSVQPAQTSVYKDTNNTQFTILGVGTNNNLGKYGVAGTISPFNPPVVGTLTKVSGTGDATVTLVSFTYNPVVNIGFTRIEPGQIQAVTEWLINMPYFVYQSATTPFLDPHIYSVILTSTSTVTIPLTVIDSSTGLAIPLLTNYKIRAYVGTGACAIQVNSSSAVIRQVGLYDTWEIFCNTRMVNTVIFTITSGTVYVTIEKL